MAPWTSRISSRGIAKPMWIESPWLPKIHRATSPGPCSWLPRLDSMLSRQTSQIWQSWATSLSQ